MINHISKKWKNIENCNKYYAFNRWLCGDGAGCERF